MYQQDYVLRQIELFSQGIARIFFHREQVSYSWPVSRTLYTRRDLWYRRVLLLLEEGKINAAENLLFEEMDSRDPRCLEAALDFYARLAALDEEQLNAAGFSREEIAQGLADASRLFGVNLDGF